MRAAARSVAGGAVAIALVALGIVALQRLVPAPADSPAVVHPPVAGRSGSPLAEPSDRSPGSPSPLPTRRIPPSPAPSRSASAAASADPVPSAPRLSLTVLNGTRRTGLAARAARRFEAGGWDVVETGNHRGTRISPTTVFYDPGQGPSAERLRREFPEVRRAAPRPRSLPGRGLTVVLAADYPG